MIKRLVAFDMDGTLINTPKQSEGKKQWKKVKGKEYPRVGWWGRKESLDLDVFDIKPYPLIYKQLLKEQSTPDTHVIVLTSRRKELRPEVQAILDKNNIHVDGLEMHGDDDLPDKGAKILRFSRYMPDLEEISVYDDRNTDIESYKGIIDELPENITFNIYVAKDGNFSLLGNQSKSVETVINEVILEFGKINKNGRIYNKFSL